MFQVKILTTIPQIYSHIFNQSLYLKGIKSGVWSYLIGDIKEYSIHSRRIDDAPYGGGSGMILRPDVLGTAIDSFFKNSRTIYYMSPRGPIINQTIIHDLVKKKELNILCARFEGIDERVLSHYNIKEISIGDFILTSGDMAALILTDSCLRLVPNFLGNKNSNIEDSFGMGRYEHLLEYPQYTRPRIWNKHIVPNILLSGNHDKIDKWRLDMSKNLTRIRRPDLWIKHINQSS